MQRRQIIVITLAGWLALGSLGAMLVRLQTRVAHGQTATEQESPSGKKELDKSGISRFMRAKLDSSQQVLEGLVTEDYKLIEQGAQQMQLMSKAAEWQIIPGPVYAQYSTEFQRSAEQLAKHAKDKNIDAAGLSYMQLTMNCVSCHRYIRGAKIAQGEPVPPGLLEQPFGTKLVSHQTTAP